MVAGLRHGDWTAYILNHCTKQDKLGTGNSTRLLVSKATSSDILSAARLHFIITPSSTTNWRPTVQIAESMGDNKLS